MGSPLRGLDNMTGLVLSEKMFVFHIAIIICILYGLGQTTAEVTGNYDCLNCNIKDGNQCVPDCFPNPTKAECISCLALAAPLAGCFEPCGLTEEESKTDLKQDLIHLVCALHHKIAVMVNMLQHQANTYLEGVYVRAERKVLSNVDTNANVKL